jgi:hypothetical protein
VFFGGVFFLVSGLLLAINPWRIGEWFVRQQPGAVPAGVSAHFVSRRAGIFLIFGGGGTLAAWGSGS